MKRHRLIVLIVVLGLGLAQGTPEVFTPEKRIVLLRGNMIETPEVQHFQEVIARAAKAGYTEIVLSDPKANTWFIADYKEQWQRNVETLRTEAERAGLEFTLAVLPYGYCTGVLAHDPHLVEGTPIQEAPLQVSSGQLVPVATASLVDGSFENFQDNRLSDWSFQDNPGEVSFIDTSVVKEGSASLRFENFAANEYGLGRVIQELEVQPFKQYRLTAWVRMENLTARLNALVKTETERDLLTQDFTFVDEEGRQKEMTFVNNETLEWTKFSFAFNSLDNTNIKLVIGAFGATGGKLWLDDLRLEDVPTLNIVRRDDLPLTLSANGQPLAEGTDFLRLEDTHLGNTSYLGKYGVFHEAPVISLTEDASLAEGEKVYLSAYHAQLVPSGHVTCALSNESMFAVSDNILQQAATFNPDGLFFMHSEIRAGGWESSQGEYEPAGRLLSMNVSRLYTLAQDHAQGKPVYIWADMFDPNHNAREYYYQMRGSLADSWEGLPQDLRMVTWWENEKLKERGVASLQFFSEQGFKQILGAYYDEDVEENYRLWQAAAQGVTGIEGVMYATWINNYDDLEKFARVWWGE